MNKPVATAYTEAAWDALQDGTELVLRLFNGPQTAAELSTATGEDPSVVERKLRRLAKAGLVRQAEDRWEVVARLVHQTRQEGMVTSLTRYLLPSLTRAAREPGLGYWAQLDLNLSPDEQATLRAGPIQALGEELNELSLRPADDAVAGTAVMVGTSDVPRVTEPAERMLETVRRAARQRATPEAAGRAVLTQFDGLFGRKTLPEAEQAVRAAVERLRPRECRAGERATYTLLLGFFVRERARAAGGDHEA
jgi:DNA-binding transcriptional ArsR family regulator